MPMWLEQSEGRGEREDWRAGRGWGQVVQGLVGCREDLGFYPGEVGVLEGCGQRRDWT